MPKTPLAVRVLLLVGLLTLMVAPPVGAGPESCDTRVNNTFDKLLECVTLEGVRQHRAAFQAIADANNGIRTRGCPVQQRRSS